MSGEREPCRLSAMTGLVCCSIKGLKRRQHAGVQGLAPVSAEGSN